MIECKKTNTYSKHQLKLKQVFTKRYGDFRLKTLQFKLSILYQNLQAQSTKLKYNKRRIERKSINNKFCKNPKDPPDNGGQQIILEKYMGKRI